MSKCIVNDVELYYEVKGEGEAIVFTHGASWDHASWQPQVDYFSKQYKTIVWDVRGHGKSTLPEGEVDSEDFTKDLIGLLDHLNIDSANLCGLSLGGHISIQVAVQHPDRVKSLILIATPFTNTFNSYERMLVPLNRFSSMFIPMQLMASLQANMLSNFNYSNKAYIEEAVIQIPKQNWVRLWDAITRMESKEHLKLINSPTLIMYGDHDTMIGSQQQYMYQEIPNAEIQVIKNANHATNLDNPQDVNQHIKTFLGEN